MFPAAFLYKLYLQNDAVELRDAINAFFLSLEEISYVGIKSSSDSAMVFSVSVVSLEEVFVESEAGACKSLLAASASSRAASVLILEVASAVAQLAEGTKLTSPDPVPVPFSLTEAVVSEDKLLPSRDSCCRKKSLHSR